MADKNEIENIVERVVTQVLQAQVAQLRDELVRRVLEELPSGSVDPGMHETQEPGPTELLRGVATIQAGSTQKEILRALLDSVSQHCGRTALFVIKSGAASGWQGRGFEDNDAVKEFALDTSRGLPERVLHEKAPFSGQTLDMDPRFLDLFGSPADEHIVMLPLLLKDKVAALVYADAGTDGDGQLDAGSLDLLVLTTSAWLEVSTLRKQTAHKEPAADQSESRPVASAAAAPAFNDPFAAHAGQAAGV